MASAIGAIVSIAGASSSVGGLFGGGGSSGGGGSVVSLGVCGNGVTEGVEECDDGNNNNRDECDNKCKLIVHLSGGVGNPDTQCRKNGFDFGIVKLIAGISESEK